MTKLITTLVLLIPCTIWSQDIKVYNKYDFITGDKLIFEDQFINDKEGTSPSHWKVEGGQVSVDKLENEKCASILKYYTILSPVLKTKNYLKSQYTVEYDTYLDAGYAGNEGVAISFRANNEEVAVLDFNNQRMNCKYPGGNQAGAFPDELVGVFENKWHRLAVMVNGKQLIAYFDQYKILEVPDCNFTANNIAIKGNYSEGLKMQFKNFRIAEGEFKVSDKIVTYGINFDFNKATIKPESMGVLNKIAGIIKSAPDTKYEIGGYTDSDGDDNYNLKLSQQRADEVKKQLISMGVNEAQLTTKGYGENNPVADNSTFEGKALNRRVEFVKLKI